MKEYFTNLEMEPSRKKHGNSSERRYYGNIVFFFFSLRAENKGYSETKLLKRRMKWQNLFIRSKEVKYI
jgi:hypothetical protein